MNFKKKLAKSLKNPVTRVDIFFTAAKNIFLFVMFLFFGVYFCISSGFYDVYLYEYFIPLYVSFLFTYIVLLCMGTLKF